MPLVALLGAGALMAASCSSPHRHRAGGATTTFPPSTTTTQPPPQYAPSPYSWERAASPALQIGGGASATLSAALAPQLTGPWQVFGSRDGPSGSPVATYWSSPDALTWAAAPIDPTAGPSQATAAARFRNMTVVVGSTGDAVGQQAAVWASSATGAPYSAETVPAGNGPSVMKLVAAGPLGMFATGTVNGRFAMWSSTNGRQWSELPGAEKVIGSNAGARINALVANGADVYAAGSIQPGATPQAALWSSSDGLDWHLVGSATSSFSGPGGMSIYSLAPLGAGLVAVGAIQQSGGWVPASWISPDGQSWSLPSVDFPSVPAPAGPAASFGASGGTAARSVAAIPTLGGANDLVATGGGPYGQAAWESVDGLHWTSLSMPAGPAAATSWRAEVTAATTDRAVVLDAEPGQPYMLTDQASVASGLSPSTATPPAVTGKWSQPSADPRVFGPAQPDAVPVSLLHLGTGRLQLTVDLVRRPQAIGPAQVTTIALTSSDGSTWAAAPGGTVPSGSPPSVPTPDALTARLPTGWTALSSAPAAAVGTWVSSTGAAWAKAGAITVPVAPSGPGSTTSSSGPTSPSPAASLALNGICTARLPSPTASNGSSPTTAAPATTPPYRYQVESVGAITSVTPSGPSSTGTVSGPTVTRSAAAWYSGTGLTWRSAPVNAPPPLGGTVSMSGCEQVGSSLVAYGLATTSSGAPQPALWRSGDGTTWARSSVSGLAAGGPAPLLSLAADGDYWLAAANPDPTANPIQPGGAGSRGPAAGAGTDAGVGPSSSLEDGRQAVWLSSDGGSAWQILDTSTAPWLGSQQSSVDLTGFVSGSAVHAATPPGGAPSTTTSGANGGAGGTAAQTLPTPVVTGVVDGQLVVWIGTPAPQASSGG